MQCALLIYETPECFSERTDPKRQGAYWPGWTASSQAISEAGIVRSSAPLQHPDSASTVVTEQRRHVQDGPYADSKEQLGGFFLMEVETPDDALAWAARAPGCTVEVRTVLPREVR